MSEVDEIEAELRGPADCWLNDRQRTRFARLLVLARRSESVGSARAKAQRAQEAWVRLLVLARRGESAQVEAQPAQVVAQAALPTAGARPTPPNRIDPFSDAVSGLSR